MRSYWIEISQGTYFELGRLTESEQHIFIDRFTSSVWRSTGLFGSIFSKWLGFTISIHRTRTRKHHISYTSIFHDFEKIYSSHDIIFIILKWSLHTLPYCFERCEMNHPINTMIFKNLV